MKTPVQVHRGPQQSQAQPRLQETEPRGGELRAHRRRLRMIYTHTIVFTLKGAIFLK